MKCRTFLISLQGLALLLLFYATAQAISLTVSPNPGRVTQTITNTVSTGFGVQNCEIQIDFGDGSSQTLGVCTLTAGCIYNAFHSYTLIGNYNVVAKTNPGNCLIAPPAPLTDTKNLQITANIVFTSPSLLPSGTVSLAYSYQLQTSGGTAPVTYTRLSGSLPLGLVLGSTGLISGIPASSGTSTFTVRATDATGSTTDQTFSLIINFPPVQVTPIPSSGSIVSTTASTQNILYRFTSSPGTSFQLTSANGQFIAGGETIATNNQYLAVPIQNGAGQTNETLTIPLSVIQRAQAAKVNTLYYQRTFSPGSTTATIVFTITSDALAPFTITRVALFFENKRPEITVEKNFPTLKAFANINFLGSGLLRGYWEVDGRVLSYINQQVTFGQMITLETPSIPPLPTFDPGAHSLRLVITNPVPQMTLPTVLYYVESQESKTIKIASFQPRDNTIWDFQPLSFQWEGLRNSSLYLIEFLKGGESGPVFSAYTRRTIYEIPEVLLKKIFVANISYSWKVKGFDDRNNLIGESDPWTFRFR